MILERRNAPRGAVRRWTLLGGTVGLAVITLISQFYLLFTISIISSTGTAGPVEGKHEYIVQLSIHVNDVEKGKEEEVTTAMEETTAHTATTASKDLTLDPHSSLPSSITVSPAFRGGGDRMETSVCQAWDETESKGQRVDGILLKDVKWMCGPLSIGNKLGFYFQTRASALAHNVTFHVDPECSKKVDSIIPWLPQLVSPLDLELDARAQLALQAPTEEETRERIRLMCGCGGDPSIAHHCSHGWPQLAPLWRVEIRDALTKWATSAKKDPIDNGTVTNHLRCGDLLDPNVQGAGEMGFLPASVYLKHLQNRPVKAIHIITQPLDGCKNGKERVSDCNQGQKCSTIVNALIGKLTRGLNLSENQVKIWDHESILWSMHHIVFSGVTFCSQSSFCVFASLGSNHVVHVGGPSHLMIPASKTILPALLEGNFVYDDEIKALTVNMMRAKNMSMDDIVQYLMEH